MSESDLGTSEGCWLASGRLRALPPVGWGRPDRVVVIAPHPDDEVLGVGGALRRFAAMGVDITVVMVTDGEASHPGSTAMTDRELAAARRRESEEGLGRLGLIDPALVWLGLPDGAVARHEHALAEEIGPILDPSALCLATWRHDGHPDHEAAGRAAGAAVIRRGGRLLEYPVWAWHWARPDASGDTLPWAQARRFELDRRSVRAKHRAIEAFTSQIRPIGPEPADRAVLPDVILDRFRRPFEVLFDGSGER